MMFAIFSVVLPIVFLVSLITHHRFSPDLSVVHADARALENLPSPVTPRSNLSDSQFIEGLLYKGFRAGDCESRYQSHLYRNKSPHKPSPYLLSILRRYEDRHKRCGPGTKPYEEALTQIASRNKRGFSSDSTDSCRYVVWISFSGLGNRILSIASTFLYALLTNRVLLVDRGSSMEDLFCEPFPHSSWFLPRDFPLLTHFSSFNQTSPSCFGHLLKSDAIKPKSVPSFLYLHLVHDYNNHDKLFFCDDQQALLSHIPWLIIKTDNYFAPSLFLSESFEKNLTLLFPDRATVFHHLGRYLFHPTNVVWGLVTRYYQTYMAKADERIGIQIRVFDSRAGPLGHVMQQLLACIKKEKILPQVLASSSPLFPSKNAKMTSVILTSLNKGYAEILSAMYWEAPTMTGEVVGVHQPSTEEFQQTEREEHNRKAWAEMYLLSLTDALVTSAWSTFGYVAQGLGGMRPWVLFKAENDTYPNPPCKRAASMEPCFHAPPFYDCKLRRGADTGLLVPHVRHCEDMSWGLKIFG